MFELRLPLHHHRPWFHAAALLLVAACGEESARPPVTPPGRTMQQAPAPSFCSNAPALLAQHANTFGAPAQIEMSLPRTMQIEQALGTSKGAATFVLDRTTHRYSGTLAGVSASSGIDSLGPWEISAADVRLRLQRDEAASVYLMAWLARRNYLTDFNPSRDSVVCEPGNLVRLHFARPDLGEPDLTFDAKTLSLRFASALASDGRRHLTEYDAWTTPDEHGVRWPQRTTSVDPHGNQIVGVYQENVHSLKCTGDCMMPPPAKLEFGWQDAVVKVPMKHHLGELLLRVGLDGTETWALLDSGANLTAVDTTKPASKHFTGSLAVTGSGAAQSIAATVGELGSLRIGALELRHVPAAAVPIPALDGMGHRRPEVVLGFSLFLGSVIHIDFEKEEISFGQKVEAFVSQSSVRIPMRILDGKPVVDVTVASTLGPFVLDTGSAGGVSMVKRWADLHGFPGASPTAQMTSRTGAGAESTQANYFRLEQALLGPIQSNERLVPIDDPPAPGAIAGLVGNEMLARCAAVTFDVQRRNLWLKPPCERPIPESKAGWRLARAPGKGPPWVVEAVMPGSAAHTAGIAPGDRVVSIGDVVADLDVTKVGAVVERPEGTTVSVRGLRGGNLLKREMTLTRFPAR